jgi:23S rRNA (cytosine1962-C5)-methyltransferase
MQPMVTLRIGKETNAAFRHPWIFSGAIEKRTADVEHGDVVTVVDQSGEVVGTGTYSSTSSIAVRLFAFGDATLDQAWFEEAFRKADARRKLLGFDAYGTDAVAYRVVFGEADGVPGLVVDRYGDVLVVQISTAGMDRLRETVVAALAETFKPRSIYERSDLRVRQEEGLKEASGLLYGDEPGEIEFVEDGLRFVADVVGGQKTGFFLDQRPLRAIIRRVASGRRVLNLFSYSGAASIAAMKGGAKSVHNVDLSSAALELGRRQAEMNGLDASAFTVQESDVFQYMGEEREPSFDMVIVDPPAFIKSARDGESGRKAYHFLNRAALQLVRDGGVFVTSSCSHFLPEEDLAFILRRASVQADVQLDLLDVVRQSPDHPQSVYFPESSYLKSFVCQVTR